MHKKSFNKFSIFLNIVFILFLGTYFFVNFLNYRIIKDVLSPICNLVNNVQGKNYTPAWCAHLNDSTPTQAPKLNTNLNLQIANPASEECVVKGAKVEMYSNDNGQFGVCVFADKSICEEWALYRGECKAGDCFKVCKYIGTSKEGWYISCTRQLLKLEKCGTGEEANEPLSGTISGDKLIILTSPITDAQLSSPFVVEGLAKISSDTVYIRVKNTAGKALIIETASLGAAQADGYAPFQRKISYEFSATKEGFIDVYNLGATGGEENLVSIPVEF